MELFSLLAKLTLDSKQYTSALEEAQDEADSFESPDGQELELDNSDYTGALDDAEEESGKFSDSVGSIFKELKGVLTGLGIAAVVTGIVSTLKEGVNLAKEHGDMIDKQSQKMGISAKEYQEWSYALNLSGASIDDLNRGLRTWQQAAGDEEAVTKLSSAFEALGIDAKEAFKKIESGENLDQLLNQTIYALADKAPGDRGWIAEALFGKNATALNALFNQTSKEIRDAKEEAEDLGIVMTDEEVKNAAAYTDAVTRLEGALQGIKEAFAADLLPILTNAANTVAKIVAFFNPRNGQKSLSEQWAGDDAAFASEMATIEGTAAAAETLADKLLAMGDTSQMTAEQYAVWNGTAKELIRLVPSLGEVIDVETGQIDGNTTSIKNNIAEWERLAKIKALQALKEKKQQDLYEKNEKLIDKQIEVNAKAGQVEQKRVESLAKVNKLLEENGYEQLSSEATLTDFFEAQNKVAADQPYNQSLQIQLANAISEWTKANYEVVQTQEEVNKLQEEIAKAKEEYAAWEAAADAMFGTLDSDAETGKKDVEELKKAIDSLPAEKRILIAYNTPTLLPKAKGDWNVPYDMPALLHRGERVLTKSQARQSEGGGTGEIVSAIQGLRNDMQNLRLMVGRKTFGRAVVDYGGSGVNDYIGRSESQQASGYGT